MHQGRSTASISYVQVDEQLLNELNLQENQFLCTEEVCFRWSLKSTLLCITKHLLSKFWSTFYHTYYYSQTDLPTQILWGFAHATKSNRYGLTCHHAAIRQFNLQATASQSVWMAIWVQLIVWQAKTGTRHQGTCRPVLHGYSRFHPGWGTKWWPNKEPTQQVPGPKGGL